MLILVLPQDETNEATELRLEHSLVSLSKWEAIHEKPFFGRDDKTEEETISYVKQMVIDDNPPEKFEKRLTREHYEGSTSTSIVSSLRLGSMRIQTRSPLEKL